MNPENPHHSAQTAPPRRSYTRETDAQKALRERPSFSIRARISLGFLLLFILSLGISIASLAILARIQGKLVFLEAAQKYSFEVQQARRFEKNFLLYGTNLEDAQEHVGNARLILRGGGREISAVVGMKQFDTMNAHLDRYEYLLRRLSAHGAGADASAGVGAGETEAELRQHGAEVVSVAEQLVARERKAVESMLLVSRRIPVVFLLVLLVLIVYLVRFLARQMLQPLNRLMAATRRIAEGDFAPIQPARRYKDEFSELAMALNHMLHQLEHRHELLVQAHKLKAVGTLTAGVAHELNNPIHNIMLTAALLEERRSSLSEEDQLEMTRDLVREAERSRRIIRSLLDFAREGEIKTNLLQVNKLVEETLQLVANQFKITKVKVEKHLAEHLPAIYGDQQQLTQVLVNLVLNALDAMPKGGALTIATTAVQNRGFVAISVTDTGHGIAEHILPQIFDPFFTTKSTVQGTGLGLSVSLGIAQKHGGDIQVESREGEGTTFRVILPVAKVPAS